MWGGGTGFYVEEIIKVGLLWRGGDGGVYVGNEVWSAEEHMCNNLQVIKVDQL